MTAMSSLDTPVLRTVVKELLTVVANQPFQGGWQTGPEWKIHTSAIAVYNRRRHDVPVTRQAPDVLVVMKSAWHAAPSAVIPIISSSRRLVTGGRGRHGALWEARCRGRSQGRGDAPGRDAFAWRPESGTSQPREAPATGSATGSPEPGWGSRPGRRVESSRLSSIDEVDFSHPDHSNRSSIHGTTCRPALTCPRYGHRAPCSWLESKPTLMSRIRSR